MANELTNEIRLSAMVTFNALHPTQVLFGVYHLADQVVTTEQQLRIPFSKIKIPKHLKTDYKTSAEGESLDPSLVLQDGDIVILLENLGAEFYVILGAI